MLLPTLLDDTDRIRHTVDRRRRQTASVLDAELAVQPKKSVERTWERSWPYCGIDKYLNSYRRTMRLAVATSSTAAPCQRRAATCSSSQVGETGYRIACSYAESAQEACMGRPALAAALHGFSPPRHSTQTLRLCSHWLFSRRSGSKHGAPAAAAAAAGGSDARQQQQPGKSKR